ncbi:unnamed protein product [marine sediment metagenome]|uniref:Uncharacterized protein n=1 Tax=marine sediment metagenome TaxID=412755 RepID=X1F9S4_9ZZZZ
MPYFRCEKCGALFAGWGVGRICEKCRGKLKEISKSEFYEEKKKNKNLRKEI